MDRIKGIIAQMTPGNSDNVMAAFDSSDLKDAIKKLQADVALLSKHHYQTSTDLAKLTADHA